ncbi:MAG: hypothetical protein ISS53_01915 [Dehalococcoidia bacterium]|nr:hypothetical protein [Dehalococcoidia bacterium]
MEKELTDYSGHVCPYLHLMDLSKETIAKLAIQYARAYSQIDGHWYDAVAERYGEQVARDLDYEVWMRNIPPTAMRTLQALGHEEKDIAAILKVTQFHPAAGGGEYLWDYEVELKNPNLGIVKVLKCRPYSYYMAKENLDFVRVMCRDWDIPMFGITGTAVVPNVKCRPLVIPPYDAPYETKPEPGVVCVWEYSLEPDSK